MSEVVEQCQEAAADVYRVAWKAHQEAKKALDEAKAAVIAFGPGTTNGVRVQVVASPKVVDWDSLYADMGVTKEEFSAVYKHSKGETIRVSVVPV